MKPIAVRDIDIVGWFALKSPILYNFEPRVYRQLNGLVSADGSVEASAA